MKTAIHALNTLEREGVLKRYAIGGAMGALFYVEPFTTFDLDVFVIVPQPEGAVDVVYEDVPTRVLSAEHLVAVSVQTGRAKDRMRIPMFQEANVLNIDKLQAILHRHGLMERWLAWTR